MDKFAYWTLKVLSFVFLASAACSLVLWILDKDSYEATSWMVWVSAILTSLFFSATSWVLCRMIERIFETSSEDEIEYSEDE